MPKCMFCLLAALLLTAAAPTPLVFDLNTVGGPRSNAQGELYSPSTTPPFPAIVVLHGCDGIGPHYRDWARRLASWGYAALLVDSFRPRGVQNVCNHGMDVPPQLQAADAFAAADYLRSMPTIRSTRIGVIGFSHGGWAVLNAVLADTMEQNHARPFAAAVAFYPGCDPPGSPLISDTLILIGEADDWTPARRCVRWRELVQANGRVTAMKLYPGEYHGFDTGRAPHLFAGHTVGGDPAAAADAIEETRRFLAERLMR